MNTSTTWLKSVKYLAEGIKSHGPGESITDRQERVAGFNQSVMDRLRVLQIGAGGLGGEISQGLVRKGVGQLEVFDGDTVELSNLSRQFFYEEDVNKNKAICLGKNLMREAVNRTRIITHPLMFQRAIEEKMDFSCDIAICAPDNDDTRAFVARYFYKRVPIVFTGMDRNASTGYVFIQQPAEACFGCALPYVVNSKREPCPNTPAIIDLVKIIAGYVLFAIDSTLMGRKRGWNFRQFFLGGFIPEIIKQVERKKDCPLCRGNT